MNVTINNSQTKNKDLVYEEGFWTGKRSIKYNGVDLVKIKRNIYEYNDEKNIEQFEIKGNQLIGVTIKMFGSCVEVLRKLTWYEIVMAIMVAIPCILFGAIGGAFGGGIGSINLYVIRQIDKWWMKLIISALFTAISVLLSYIFAFLVFRTFFIF